YGDKLAALGFEDGIRDGVPALLAEVRSLGIEKVVLLTGDTNSTAIRVGAATGIEEVRGGLLPGDKVAAVQDFVSKGKHVLMVGDGINDASALTSATVGVAMGGLGSDIAMNAADVVLMHDRLDRIPLLIRLGRQAAIVIRSNLLFASAIIVTLSVFSLCGRLP